MPAKQNDFAKNYALASDEYEGISRASEARTFQPADNMTVRSDYARPDYEFYRPSQRTPKTPKEKMEFCMSAYSKVAIIRNVVDLMSDFGVQGIRFNHTNPTTERFLNTWFDFVGGYHFSERFLNMLYRTANVPVYRQEGKIPLGRVKDWKAKASLLEDKFEELDIPKRVIPIKYTMLNPTILEVLGGNFSTFSGNYQYVLKLPELLNLNNGSTLFPVDMSTLLQELPEDIRNAYNAKQSYIPLDKDKFTMYFYKKDDWLVWAEPMLASLISSLIQLEKMHLADLSALDGIISSVRLWKLGFIDTTNPQNSIIPTPASLRKLRGILQNNVGGGTMDLVWGPDIDFKETESKIYQSLGDGKYKQVMSELYGGLGIPASLTGDGSAGGFTNNYISMKTLVDRLSYGREILKSFWYKEVKRLQEAVGFVGMPDIYFEHMSFTDEAAYLTLLLNLADRNIISDKAIRERLNMSETIENARLKSENGGRDNQKLPPKASPYHNPQHDKDMEKILLQSGSVPPSQVGVRLKDKKPGEKPPAQILHEVAPKPAPVAPGSKKKKKTAKPSAGRPKNKGDSTKRKTRKPKPRTTAFVNTLLWANKATEIINDTLLPGLPDFFGKKNLRQLTVADKISFENLKFRILRNHNPLSVVNQDSILLAMSQERDENQDMVYIADELIRDYTEKTGKTPTVDEIRNIQCSAYAYFYEADDDVTE